jgi:geranylgeranyl pyrophosphate synthase
MLQRLGCREALPAILTLAVGELFGAQPVPLLCFACAVELIHCYSLIHDDLPALDNDDIRRGKASCHKRFGEAIALLAGDALLTEAFFIISDPAVARLFGSSLTAQLIREISESAGMRGMISGQSRELELDGRVVTPEFLEDSIASRRRADYHGSPRRRADRRQRTQGPRQDHALCAMFRASISDHRRHLGRA